MSITDDLTKVATAVDTNSKNVDAREGVDESNRVTSSDVSTRISAQDEINVEKSISDLKIDDNQLTEHAQSVDNSTTSLSEVSEKNDEKSLNIKNAKSKTDKSKTLAVKAKSQQQQQQQQQSPATTSKAASANSKPTKVNKSGRNNNPNSDAISNSEATSNNSSNNNEEGSATNQSQVKAEQPTTSKTTEPEICENWEELDQEVSC